MGMLLVISAMDWFEGHVTLQSEIVSFWKRRTRRLSIHRLSYMMIQPTNNGDSLQKQPKQGYASKKQADVEIMSKSKRCLNRYNLRPTNLREPLTKGSFWGPTKAMGTLAFNTEFPSTRFVFAGPMIRNHQSQDLCDSQAANEFRKCWPPRFKIGSWMVQTPNCITTT